MRHLDRSDLFHALFTFFLSVKQLAFTGNIAAIALGDHVLAQRFNCLTRNNVGPNGRLNGDVKHLARDDFAHFGHHGPAPVLGLRAVHNDGQGINLFTVEQNVDLHHIGGAVFLEFVVHGRIAP